MTQTKSVITKRMNQKETMVFSGTGGRFEKPAEPAPEPESEPIVIATPKAVTKPKPQKKSKK